MQNQTWNQVMLFLNLHLSKLKSNRIDDETSDKCKKCSERKNVNTDNDSDNNYDYYIY